VTPGWSPVRIAWALFGAIALIAGGAGTYVALQRGAATVPEQGSVLRMHASPRVLPELAFVDGAGKPRTLSDFRGKTVLLNVWATWCPPCREEMPSLDRLQKALGGPGFEVVALSLDAGGADVVKRFYRETGIAALAIYIDPGMRATAKLATPGVPTTLLIDAKGRELGRHAGPAQWDGEEAMRVISKHVDR
jgi:thiol-disulfide isomerase/thioredoxin